MAYASQAVDRDGSTLLRADRVLTASSTGIIRDGVVRLEGDRIAGVEPWKPEHGEVSTFGDATILPGLIDAHAHISLFGDDRDYASMMADSNELMALVAVRNLRRHLAAGVTTLRDNGGRDRITFHVREAIARGYFVGPRLLLSGRPITHTAGHFHFCNGVADGEDEIRRAVRSLVAEGADHIKIMASGGATAGNQPYSPSYTTGELRTAVEAAHELGRLTTAHCRSKRAMEYALDAGLDCLEHSEFLVATGTATLGTGSLAPFANAYDKSLAARMLDSPVFVSFTPQTGGYDTLVRLRSKRAAGKPITQQEQNRADNLERYYADKLGVLRSLIQDGFLGRLVISSDAGPFDTEFGRMRYGAELAVEAGMTPMQAIESMTRTAADACGITEAVGTLEVGKKADVLVVRGDPTRDVTSLSEVMAVYVSGRVVAFSDEEWDPRSAD